MHVPLLELGLVNVDAAFLVALDRHELDANITELLEVRRERGAGGGVLDQYDVRPISADEIVSDISQAGIVVAAAGEVEEVVLILVDQPSGADRPSVLRTTFDSRVPALDHPHARVRLGALS